jgi:hypothetical protein
MQASARRPQFWPRLLLVTAAWLLLVSPVARTLAQDAPEQPPLPQLTRDGARWGKKLIRNAVKIAKGGQVTKPPFLASSLAEPMAVVARVAKKAKKRGASIQTLESDPDFLALLGFVRSQVAASPWESVDEYRRAFIEALNRLDSTFPVATSLPVAIRASETQTEAPPEYRPLQVLTTTQAQELIYDRSVQESERRFWDGALVLDNGPGTASATQVYYVNGATNTVEDGIGESQRIKAMLGDEVLVNHIHNGTSGTIKSPLSLVGDALEALRQRLLGATPNDPAPRQVTEQILSDLDAGKPVWMFCHSQGAQVCINGLRNALQQAPADADRILANTHFTTFGGYAKDSDWPAGTKVDIWKNPQDPVPGLAGALSPEGVANLLSFLTVDAHAMRRYLNNCVVQSPPPAGCPCRTYDTCAAVVQQLRQRCAELGLNCPGLANPTTTTSTTTSTTTTSTTTTTSSTTTTTLVVGECSDATYVWGCCHEQIGGPDEHCDEFKFNVISCAGWPVVVGRCSETSFPCGGMLFCCRGPDGCVASSRDNLDGRSLAEWRALCEGGLLVPGAGVFTEGPCP